MRLRVDILPLDPIGDTLAVCYRRLLIQIDLDARQNSKSTTSDVLTGASTIVTSDSDLKTHQQETPRHISDKQNASQ